MVFQTINKKLLELGPSLGFLYKKKRVESSTARLKFKTSVNDFFQKM